MLSYAIRRILLTIPTLIAVAVLVFFVLRVVPGDIVEIKLTAEGGMVSENTEILWKSGKVCSPHSPHPLLPALQPPPAPATLHPCST